MFAQQFKKAIQVAINANVPLWVWGQAGIGKSAIIRTVTAALKREHIDVRPTQMDPVDMGIPYVKDGVCYRAIPNWLPKDGNTLIAVEELPDAPMSVQCALYPGTLDEPLPPYRTGVWLRLLVGVGGGWLQQRRGGDHRAEADHPAHPP